MGLLAAGGATFGASYGAALLLGFGIWTSGAAEPCDDCGSRAATIAVPVAGPWLLWRKEPAGTRESAIWPAAWGGIQAVGAIMLIAGIVGHDVIEQRPRRARPTVSIVPALTPQLGALALNVSW